MYKTLAKKVAIIGAALALFAVTALPVSAKTAGVSATSTASAIACVGDAVNTREASIGTAMTTFTSAVDTAYSVRANALKDAYAQTKSTAVKTSVKTAWKNFSKSVKDARSTWQKSQNAAWKTYRTTATTCKAPVGIGDGAYSKSENSGN